MSPPQRIVNKSEYKCTKGILNGVRQEIGPVLLTHRRFRSPEKRARDLGISRTSILQVRFPSLPTVCN
ncbi:hypothetical protein AVEN_266907-1, partial [Araneus ventricosus]